MFDVSYRQRESLPPEEDPDEGGQRDEDHAPHRGLAEQLPVPVGLTVVGAAPKVEDVVADEAKARQGYHLLQSESDYCDSFSLKLLIELRCKLYRYVLTNH